MSSNNTYAIGHSKLCILLGFLHTLLLGIGPFSLVASSGHLTGYDYLKVLSLGICLLITEIIAWLLLRKIHFLLLYFSIGLGLSVFWAIVNSRLTKTYENISFFVGAVSFVLCMVIFIVHSAARAEHGEMKADYLATHGDDVPFRMEIWEVPTVLTHPRLAVMGWFVVQYIIGLLAKQPLYWRTVFYLALCDIIVCFLFQYINHFTTFVQDNHASANLPVHTIKRVHSAILIIGLVLLVACLVPAVLYNKEPLSELSFETPKVPPGESMEEIMMPPVTMEEQTDSMSELLDAGEIYEPPAWVMYLLDFIFGGIALAFVIGLVLAIIQKLRHAMKNFAIQDEDEVIFLEDETSDIISETKSGFRSHDGYFSVNKQIRRKYKKTIRKATDGTPDRTSTPTELENRAGLLGTEEMTKLHDIYEKARYSENGASRKDFDLL